MCIRIHRCYIAIVILQVTAVTFYSPRLASLSQACIGFLCSVYYTLLCVSARCVLRICLCFEMSGKGTSVAKGKGQKTLSCGHRTGCWDSHEIICFRCCVRQNGCSREKPCYVSAFWGPKTWNLAEAVRTYQSKKAVALAKKGLSGTGATQAVGVSDPLELFLVTQKSATVGSGSAGTVTPPLAINTVPLASGHRTPVTGHRTPDTGQGRSSYRTLC